MAVSERHVYEGNRLEWIGALAGRPSTAFLVSPASDKQVPKFFKWVPLADARFGERMSMLWAVCAATSGKRIPVGVFAAPDRKLAAWRNGNDISEGNYALADLSNGRFFPFRNHTRLLAALSFYMADDRQAAFEEELSGGRDRATGVLKLGEDIRNVLRAARPPAVLAAFQEVLDFKCLTSICENMTSEAAAAVLASKDEVFSRICYTQLPIPSKMEGTYEEYRKSKTDRLYKMILERLNA